ncbi:MAG: membrane protein insertion efficiency factor YidD [Legionellaceae bacterium]|nr:membrane protein insertion efficiency factor YidD [Legionellaceae bacterium]
MEQIKRYRSRIACFPIQLYRVLLRPFLPACCRFYPSCSAYAMEAIQHHGILKGTYKAMKRLLRCHPWSDGGYDPVQLSKEKH